MQRIRPKLRRYGPFSYQFLSKSLCFFSYL